MQGSTILSWTANPSVPASTELEQELAPAPAPPAVNGAGGPNARRIVAAHRLPLRAAEDPDSPFGFAFSIDPNAVVFQLSRGPLAPVTFIGTLPASAESNIVPSDELADYLMKKLSCLPVYLDGNHHSEFYDDFCKHYLWPLVHYLLPLSPAHDGDDLRFDAGTYRTFLAVNKKFAERVIQVLSPEDGDLVIIHDYHLWVLPTILRHKCPRAGVGFFLHSPFPSPEIFGTVPIRDDLLRGLLNADLVGFQNADYARHFVTCCSAHLGVSGGAQIGDTTGINYHGRIIVVKTLSIGLDLGRLRATLATPEAAAKAKDLDRMSDDAMHAAVTTMSAEEKKARHRSNYDDYLCADDAVTWAQAFDDALQLACRDHSTTSFAGLGLAMSYRAAVIPPGITTLVAMALL